MFYEKQTIHPEAFASSIIFYLIITFLNHSQALGFVKSIYPNFKLRLLAVYVSFYLFLTKYPLVLAISYNSEF